MTLQARHVNLSFPLSNSMLNPIYTNSDAAAGGGVATAELCDSVFPSSCSQVDNGAMLHMAKTMNRRMVNLPMKDDRILGFTNDVVSRKLQREVTGGHLSVQSMNQQFELDRLIYLHMEKVKRDVEEQRRMQMNRLVQVMKEAITERMKEKDEEIEEMRKLNAVLHERAKSLYLENQLWRDLAQSNEARANELRWNLEQLVVQVNSKAVEESVPIGDENGDAESCCGSNGWNSVSGEQKRMCRICGGMESCVLVLPCRHLCLCTACGPTLDVCPVCKSIKNATVHVTFS